MKTLMQVVRQNQNWLTKWVFYPIAAYFSSFVIGLVLFMPLVFIVLLAGIQWKRIQRLTGNTNAVYWLFSLVGYALITWLVWQLPVTNPGWTGADNVARYVVIYFGVQMLGELVFNRLVTRWWWGRFALANGLAAGCWLGGYCIMNRLAVDRLGSSALTNVWMGIGIPALGVLGNLITGIGLLAAVEHEQTDMQPEQAYEVRPVD